MIFTYTVSTKEGKIEKGEIEAFNRSEAIATLLAKGYLILSLKEKKKWFKLKFPFERVSDLEKIYLIKNLSLMTKAGLPLPEIFDFLIDQAKSRKLKEALKEIKKRISEGLSLYSAFLLYPEIFPPIFLGLIKLGEESGQLANVSEHLHYLFLSQYEFKKKINSALIYPAMIIITALFVFLSFFTFLLPKITQLFTRLEIKLPLVTRILVWLINFFQKNFPFIFLVVIILIVSYFLLSKKREIKKIFSSIDLSLPIVGKILREINLSHFSKNLGLLLKSGMPIERALILSAEITQDEVYKERIKKILEMVRKGEKLSTSMESFPKEFPKNFTKIIAAGERSGNLVESLEYLSSFYEAELERDTKDLTIAFEPLLLVIIGLLVAFVALAIISPIYQYISALGGLR
jgi:type II secretory pathway component PulF